MSVPGMGEFDDIHMLVELPAGSTFSVHEGANGTTVFTAVCSEPPDITALNRILRVERYIPLEWED